MNLITVPIFPLDGAFLAPGFSMPFYIFEPRYQEMLRWALEHDRRIAIAMPAPGHSIQSEHQPPVVPIASLGEIVKHTPLEDGHADIQVIGIGRVRIVEELPQAWAFRMVRAEPVTETEVDAEHAEEFATGIAVVRAFLRERLEGPVEQLDRLTPTQLIDATLIGFPVDLGVKVCMFAEMDLGKRLRMVLACIERSPRRGDEGPDGGELLLN